jgi:hypothetical protein
MDPLPVCADDRMAQVRAAGNRTARPAENGALRLGVVRHVHLPSGQPGQLGAY